MSTDDESQLDPNQPPNNDTSSSQAQPVDDPDAIDDLLPAYAIGATDPEETEYLNAGLAGQPDAATELAEYATMNRALLHSAEYRAPSPELAAAIRAEILSEPRAADIQNGSAYDVSVWQRLLHDRWPWPRIATAVLILLLLVSNIAFALRVNTLQEEQRRLSEQLLHHNDMLAVLVNSGAQETILPAVVEDSNAQAIVRWLVDRPVAVLFANHFPALEPGQVYQLWLIRDGERSSGGLFTVDYDGFGTLVIETDEPLNVYERMGITPEPAGGSPGPTGSPVVRGPL